MSQNFEGNLVVERILSQLEGGCIFTGRQEDGNSIRVKYVGRDIKPIEGDAYLVTGQLMSYQGRYGRVVPQVVSKRMKRTVSSGHLIGPWLLRLPNIGPTRAQRLVETFGHELPSVLRDVGRMADVAKVLDADKPALAMKIAAQLYAAMAVDAGVQEVKLAEAEFLVFLERLGVRETRLGGQLWRMMAGKDAIDRLRRNPYVPACLMDWKLADRVGQRLLRQIDENADLINHAARLAGALNNVWRELLSEGDTATTEARLTNLLELRGVDARAAIQLAGDTGLLRRVGPLVRVPGAAWLEDQVASALLSIERAEPSVKIPDMDALDTLVRDAESASSLRLTEEQHAAVVRLLKTPVAALQGGAGVGKTTVMKVLTTAWDFLGGDVVMGALAGKAALTLSRGASSLSRPRLAYTIARLIGMLERQCEHKMNPEARRPASDVPFTENTLLVIDEAGMLDTPSLHRLLCLLPKGARILFAGDEGQLPPVGIGKVFHDLVSEGSRVARLTKVLRQADDSAIPTVSRGVRNGYVPELTFWNGQTKGVFFVSMDDIDKIQRRLRSQGELMVVAATRATVTGINEVESFAARTPETLTRRLGPLATVAEGDPVVMTSNRYQDSLFNGLLGTVTSIDGPSVTILWDGEVEPRALPNEAEGDIDLAYAITCHKAQGSSAEAILVIVENSILVTREWLYTAITRGRELVLLAADAEAIRAAVARRTIRTTGFSLPPAAPTNDISERVL